MEEKEQNLQEKYQKKIEQFDKEYNYYEREYFYRLAIAERFIENLSKTLAKGSSLSEDEAKKLIEDNIDDRFVTDYFVEVDYSKKNNTKLDIKAILEDLNYTEPESKETVKNNYTSYNDDYDK